MGPFSNARAAGPEQQNNTYWKIPDKETSIWFYC